MNWFWLRGRRVTSADGLPLGYLATDSKGQTVVVVAMLSDPAAALPPSAEAGLLAIVQGAFGLVR